MKNILFLLVFNWLNLSAQPYASYRWVQLEGQNYVRKTEYTRPMGMDSVITTSFKFYSDTAQMRAILTATVIEKAAQATELTAQANRVKAEADSLLTVLVDLNDGFGALYRMPNGRDVIQGDDSFRWGALRIDDLIPRGSLPDALRVDDLIPVPDVGLSRISLNATYNTYETPKVLVTPGCYGRGFMPAPKEMLSISKQ